MADLSLARSSALVVLVSLLAGVVAVACDVSPTGSETTDVIVTFVFAAAVTWFGAAAPWWALTVAGVIAAAAAGLNLWMAPAVVAVVLSVFMCWDRWSQPWLKSVATGGIVITLLNLRFHPFFGASAIVAGAVALFIVIVGLVWRERRPRLVAIGFVVGVFVVALLSAAALGVVTFQARDDLQHGYDLLNDGLEQLRDGETATAAQTMHQSATLLGRGADRIDVFWGRPARLIPVVAQHRAALTDIVSHAAESVAAAANALDAIDLDRLQVVNGRVDVQQLATLSVPLDDLDQAVEDMQSVLGGIESPWLVDAVRTRVDDGRDELDKARSRTFATAQAAELGPAMLGGDGPRTYLVVFTSPGHSRAQSGVITNWAEIEIADGQITQTGFGRTADLVGTDPTTSATAWADVTATPDWPTAAANLAPMYASVRRNVDGVLMIDPTGLASLLSVAGPITIEEVGRPFDGPTLLEFLNAGQYELDAATRRTATEAAASAALTQFLSATLPAASEFGHDLGPAVTEGHILGWARRIDEEALFRSVGMSGALPELDGRDGLAVVSNSVNGSEVDTFVSRSITDEVTFDEESGAVTSRVTVTVNNGAPHGVSRTRLLVYSALTAERYEVDGKPVRFATSRDQGWNTAGAVISVPPGAQKTVVVTLHGAVAPHDYALVWRPQPLANPDSVVIHVRSADGDDLLEFTGELPRLSQIDAVGVRPLR